MIVVRAVKDLCWRQFTAVRLRCRLRWSCQRSVLASIHSLTGTPSKVKVAVKDLCWRQFTADVVGGRAVRLLSKICAGVNSQRGKREGPAHQGCQRSVLASIHSLVRPHLIVLLAVKDLCWRQFTAVALNTLHKTCCQRSVLASIHSLTSTNKVRPPAVKDLCWRQFTAIASLPPLPGGLSKICAGVNSQLPPICTPAGSRCQRSVLASIHSYPHLTAINIGAVKDLCWRQFTAVHGG